MGNQEKFVYGIFDILGHGLLCAEVLDSVSAPGGVELDQPGRMAWTND